MANHFVKASFVLTVTDAEAEVFRDIDEAAEIVRDSDVEQDRRVAAYSARSDAFRSCFPPAEADAFGGFLAIFSDPDYPRLGFSLQVDPSDGSGNCKVWLYGDQVDVETARSEEHTSELQSLMRTSYAVFCLKKKKLTLRSVTH